MDRFAVWGLICLAVGCGFLVSALRIYLARKRFLATAQTAAGTVVEVRVRGIGRNAESVPTLEFQLPGGQAQRTESWMGSGFQRFERVVRDLRCVGVERADVGAVGGDAADARAEAVRAVVALRT